MNINTLFEMINNFNLNVIESGFLRDLQAYITTIAQPQNSQNIVLLKDIASKTNESLKLIYNSDLPDVLKILIPVNKENIFTNTNHVEFLDHLLSDPKIETPKFHSDLTNILNKIVSQITNNRDVINKFAAVLTPYYNAQADKYKDDSRAIISLIFKNRDKIKSLKQFSSYLIKWDRAIFLYHQLMSSKSPEDIEMVSIQNGSIDVIINMDVNVAINFTEIVKYGLGAFAAYLAYKSKVQDIVKYYYGNKKLIESEKDRESELLKNIANVIEEKINEQHMNKAKEDKHLSPDNPTKMVSIITKTVSEHIVAGNDIKLLIKPDDEKIDKLITETNKESLIVRNGLKELSSEDKKILIDYYTIKEEEEKPKEQKSKK